MTAFERDVATRLKHLIKTGRMWGSPEELEAAALHLVHVLRAARGGDVVGASRGGSETVGATSHERETISASRGGAETVGATSQERETVSASREGAETVGATCRESETVSASHGGAETVGATSHERETVSASREGAETVGASPSGAHSVSGPTLADTFSFWQRCGGPFAGDPDEHARMRSQLFGEDDALARGQVLTGYARVWASLNRDPAREAAIAPWLETLLDDPTPAGAPDRLNIVLFTLMGFVAAEPARFVEALSAERERIGGHALRPLHVVAPPGPVDAALGWARTFTSFTAVIDGLASVLRALELDQT